MKENLEHLARRVADDPFFLAAPVSRYQRAEGVDEAALAARLRCPVETLTHVRLCRNPFPDAPRFWQDVQKIAARFDLDAKALAEIVRYGQSLLRVQGRGAAGTTNPSGFLMAARDGEETSNPSETPP